MVKPPHIDLNLNQTFPLMGIRIMTLLTHAIPDPAFHFDADPAPARLLVKVMLTVSATTGLRNLQATMAPG
jgi:hypothetical protein